MAFYALDGRVIGLLGTALALGFIHRHIPHAL